MTSAPVGRGALILAVLLLLPGAPRVTAARSDAARLSVQEYIAQLDAITAAFDQSPGEPSSQLSVLVDDLPAAWHVETPQRTFDIPTDWLVHDLRSWRAAHDAGARERLADQLRIRRAEATLYDQPAGDAASQRVSLTEILGRAEFRDVHGPTWFDRLKQRMLEWLAGMLQPLSRSSAIPTIGRVVVYGSIAASILVLIVWMRRLLRRAPAAHAVVAGSTPPLSASWSAWFSEAESAAARGNWREAIHFAYWCAVLFLEAKGAWRPDRSRTPREYLQLLPVASTDRPALAALTRHFEPVWYGADAGGPQVFADAMASLKTIGCPPA